MQYDLFRKLPHLWSPNYPSELSMEQKLGDDAERLTQRREVEDSKRCLANTPAYWRASAPQELERKD